MSEDKADPIRVLAERIAENLFSDIIHRPVGRLVQELADGTTSGAGWSREVVADVIEKHVRKYESRRPK